MDENEAWRDVVGFEGKYRVSCEGRLQNVRSGRVLKGSPNGGGYIAVQLNLERGKGRMYYLHRLVCTAFHGAPPSPAHVVNHLSGVKLDCRASNLCWCTRRENNLHAAKLGLLKGLPGSKNPRARLTEAAVVNIRRRSSQGVSYTQLAREYGVGVPAVYRAAVGRSWKHVRADDPAHAVTEVGGRATSRACSSRADNSSSARQHPQEQPMATPSRRSFPRSRS